MVATCHHKNMVTVEHVIPLSNGGKNHINNIDIICLSCNRARNFLKQFYENKGSIVPVEYWQISLEPSLDYQVAYHYKQYHDIFLKARFG